MTLSARGTSGSDPQVVVDAAGSVTVVWTSFDGSNSHIASSRFEDDAWTPVARVSKTPQRCRNPQIVVDPSGTITAIWLTAFAQLKDQVQASQCVDGKWTTPVDLTTTQVSAAWPHLTVDPTGVVTVVWEDREGKFGRDITVQACRLVRGAWTSPEDLSSPERKALRPRVAADPQGIATAIWEETDGARRSLQARQFDGRAWATASEIFISDLDYSRQIEIVVDDAGVVTVVCLHHMEGRAQVQAANLRGGKWSRPVSISGVEDDAFGPHAAVDSRGVVTAIWRSFGDSSSVIRTARAVEGTWSEPEVLCPAAGESQFDQFVAANHQGALSAIWEGSLDGNEEDFPDGSTIVQTSYGMDGDWSTPETLSGDHPLQGTDLGVVIDRRGIATAVWTGPSGIVQVARHLGTGGPSR